MTSVLKDLFLICGIVLLILYEVECLPNHKENTEEEIKEIQKDSDHETRGIIGDLIQNLIPGGSSAQIITQQQPLININPPNVYPNNAIAPTFQIPYNVYPSQTQNQPIQANRPLFGGLFSSFIGSREQQTMLPNRGYNTAWIDYAMQKCALVDPSQITAILPTESNGLRAPKMYYFQNETSAAVPWFRAQEECTKKGMSLVTVNNAAENRILQDKLRTIMAGATPGSTTAGFWIGLNNLNAGRVPTWVGDGSSTFLDWLPGEPPAPPARWCASYKSLSTADNIHFDARQCLNGNPDETLRYICEVSDDCTALFMSRFPTKNHHHHNLSHGK